MTRRPKVIATLLSLFVPALAVAEIEAGSRPDPADTVLHFSSHGVLVQQSGALGELAMLTLTGPLDDDASTSYDGVRILAGASIHLTDLVITKFRDGVSSIQGATAFATDVTAEQNRRNGYLAQEGGVMYLKLGGTSNGSGLTLPTEATLAADGSYIGD